MLVRTKDLGSTKTHVKFSKTTRTTGSVSIMPLVLQTRFEFHNEYAVCFNQVFEPLFLRLLAGAP